MAQLTDSLGSASNGPPDQLLESLGRLSKKAGVLATIVLDRSSGAILKSTGSITLSRSSGVANSSSGLNVASNSSDEALAGSRDTEGIDHVALMVWNFMNAAGGLVQGLDSEDEVRLLRLRTKRNELVIVPDPKYLLVVVHETPSA